MKKNRDLSPDAKIGFGEKLAYGVGGGFATNAITLFINTFLLVYLAEIVHVNTATAAGIIAVSKILDGVSDLLAGRIIDRTHHRLGKARIWLLRMIPATVVGMALLFMVPKELQGFAQTAYIFVMYNLVSTVCYTMTNVAYLALNGLMTFDQTSRGINGGISMAGGVVAAILGNATIIPLLKLFSRNPDYSAYGDQTGWIMLVILWLVIGMLGQLWVVLGTRERVEENTEEQNGEAAAIPFLTTLKALVTNKYWVYNLMLTVIIFFMVGATGSTSTFYMTYVVGNADLYGAVSSASNISMLVGVLIGFGTMARIGKRNSVLIGVLIRGIGSLLPIISNDVWILILSAVLGGFGYGIAGCAFPSMVQDTLTYGHWKYGFSMIGMGNAANSFSGKIGNSLGVAVLGWILNGTGFVPGAAAQAASAIGGLRFSFIWLPALLNAIAVIFIVLYDLDKIYPKIEKDLKEGRYAPGVAPRQ